MLGYDFTPKILEYFAFTGMTLPWNFSLSRFRRTVHPTDPSLSDAPITAILRGINIASKLARDDFVPFVEGSNSIMGGKFMITN